MATGAQVVSEADKFLGVPYVYGGTSPSGFDCSGLVQYVYKQLGISLPRTSSEQFGVGTPVAANQLQAGDLVFAQGSDGPPYPGHVGIYDGAGHVIQAAHTGRPVDDRDTLSNFQPTGFRRVVGGGAGVSGTTGSPTSAGSSGGGGSSAGGASGFLSGLLGIPLGSAGDLASGLGGIVSFFEEALKLLQLLFQPSFWIRVFSGIFGFLFLIGGIVFLVREANHA